MKTPREILLNRHAAANPKLDAIRATILKEANPEETKERSFNLVAGFLGCSQAVWRELIFPARRIWAGLASAWLLILAVNLHLNADAPGQTAKSPESGDFILTFREQQKVLAELTLRLETPAVEPPKPFVPRPRSEARIEFLLV